MLRQVESNTHVDPNMEFSRCLMYLEVPSLRIMDSVMNIKNETSRYLNRDFYNLVTVCIPDSRYYRAMKAMASDRLGLSLSESYLPMGSLGQGMDLLEIMHNIDAFVTQYSYNMNMQQFIEFRPSLTASTKHLNVLTIASIASSVQQHGLGVLSTTVNYTYQHLAEQFNAFSRFLSDDYMQGYLSRENRWFEKHKNEVSVNNTYPHQRAMKFVTDMKRLGELIDIVSPHLGRETAAVPVLLQLAPHKLSFSVVDTSNDPRTYHGIGIGITVHADITFVGHRYAMRDLIVSIFCMTSSLCRTFSSLLLRNLPCPLSTSLLSSDDISTSPFPFPLHQQRPCHVRGEQWSGLLSGQVQSSNHQDRKCSRLHSHGE